MPSLISDRKTLTFALRSRALAEGFDGIGITRAQLSPTVSERLHHYVNLGHHGEMGWMKETLDRRASPDAMWPEARSAVMFALAYTPDIDPMVRLHAKDTGVISVYALNRDYHDVIKGKLKRIAQWFARRSGAEVKVFVDTAPLMEKPLAQQAGLGWQGKHTNLVSRELGSWFFIGAMLTACELMFDDAEADHCGSCQACLDVCPTRAFPAPYQLDARRCISYLTIEHSGHIDPEFREAIGNRVYGCDDCLAVCPWNKFAAVAREAKLQARDDLKAPSLERLLALDDTAFRQMFSGSPVKRIGRDRFIRNCLIAAGNSGDPVLLRPVMALLPDTSAIVRAMAVWALRKLGPAELFAETALLHVTEKDACVAAEWGAP